MNRLHYYFVYPEVFWLLPSLALAWLALLWGWRQKRRAVRLLGRTSAVHKLLRTSPRARRLSGWCLFLGLLLLLVGAAGPRWGWDVPRDTVKEHDLVIVLDASRSMFAEQPSRLERALRALYDLADRLQEKGGQRLALIVFAAQPHLVFPLTRDYDHFRIALKDIQDGDLPADIYPGGDDSPDSGTRIGAALALAAQSFDADSSSPRAVLLLSDGDDPRPEQEEWKQGVHAARTAKVVVHTVGVGDPNQENVIMVKEVKTVGRKKQVDVEERPLQFKGKIVKTKLEEKVLQSIAESTGGVYLAAQTKDFRLGSMLPDILARQAANAANGTPPTSVPVLQPRQNWFFWPALVLLSATLLFRDRSANKRRPLTANRAPVGNGVLVRCMLLSFAAIAMSLMGAFTPEEDWIREGNAAFARGDLETALSLYEKAEAGATDPGLVAFNKAAVLYRLKRYREAELHYLRCLEDRQAPPVRQAQAVFNLGNALLRQADDKNVDTLDRAIDAFSVCLSQRELSPQLAADAQYNLELARWLRLQATPTTKPPPEDGNHTRPPQKPKGKEKPKDGDKQGKNSSGSDEAKKGDGSDSKTDEKSEPSMFDKLGGPSQMRNLPNTDTPQKVAAEDIVRHLEEAVRRIREQRRHKADLRAGAGPNVKNW